MTVVLNHVCVAMAVLGHSLRMYCSALSVSYYKYKWDCQNVFNATNIL